MKLFLISILTKAIEKGLLNVESIEVYINRKEGNPINFEIKL